MLVIKHFMNIMIFHIHMSLQASMYTITSKIIGAILSVPQQNIALKLHVSITRPASAIYMLKMCEGFRSL